MPRVRKPVFASVAKWRRRTFSAITDLVTSVWYWRKRLHRFRRHLFDNVLLGLAIELIFLIPAIHDSGIVRTVENFALDQMIYVYGMSGKLNRPSDAYPFCFIDIDERTYRAWGEPFFTPREKVLQLIRFAARGAARVIIVDVDLTRSASGKPGELSGGEQALAEYLHEYPSDEHCEDSPSHPVRCPPIILARTFEEPLDSQSYEPLGPKATVCREPRVTFLEASLCPPSPTDVYWASVLYDPEKDQSIRNWRLWEPNCSHNEPQVTASVQLLTVALLANRDKGEERLACWLSQFKPESCGNCAGIKPHPTQDANCGDGTFGNVHLSADTSDLSQRILYAIPREIEIGADRPRVHLAGEHALDVPNYTKISAYYITDRSLKLSYDEVRNRVAVIGGSYLDSRDLYPTPLGRMPGALVLINSIHSLTQHDQLTTPNLAWRLTILLLGVFVMSALFAKLHHFWATLLSGAFVIVGIGFLSFVFFSYGRWLDFAVPLLAVELHSMAEQLKEALESRKHKEARR